MEPKKYWWMSIQWLHRNNPGSHYIQQVVDEHPFIHMKGRNTEEVRLTGSYYELRNWKLISVEEYNLWNDLNNKQ